MKSKKINTNIDLYLLFSLAVNAVSLITIFYLLYKHKSTQKEHTKKMQTSREESQSTFRGPTKSGGSNRSSIKTPQITRITYLNNQETQTQAEKSKLNLSKSAPQVKITPELPQNDKQDSNSSVQIRLKQQIELEQERNRYLEERLSNIEKELAQLQSRQSRQSPQFGINRILVDAVEYNNMKNELEFCQKELAQSYENQKELKYQIEAYEKIGQHTFNHTELQQLIETNRKYKEIIFHLQKYLLKNQYDEVNFSFTQF